MRICLRVLIAVPLLIVATPFANATLVDLSRSQHVDLGDIGSDGETGRQLHVRELHDAEVGRKWAFYPPHQQLPDIFPEPTPNSPAQQDLHLTAVMPLVVVIPQLQHLPMLGRADAKYHLDGNTITVEASLHMGSAITHTIYGPHEFLLPIGQLPAGDYRLKLNLERTTDLFDPVVTMSGFMDFRVYAVPEPTTASGVLVALTALVCGFRRTRELAALPPRWGSGIRRSVPGAHTLAID